MDANQRFVKIFSVRSLACAMAVLALTSCSNPVDLHGNLPDIDKVAEIKPGSTDKATVTQLLGSPSSVAAFDDNTWYYISQKIRPMAIVPAERVDQQVVVIGFDDKGLVRDIERRSLADGQTVQPNPNATPAPGREFSLLEQLIGNFGKFAGKSAGNSTPGQTPGGEP
jgi:outer membrane protein assembly factor BamE (lipoprotein component of BamABCDE complex)